MFIDCSPDCVSLRRNYTVTLHNPQCEVLLPFVMMMINFMTVTPGYNHTRYKHKHRLSTRFTVTKSFALHTLWV